MRGRIASFVIAGAVALVGVGAPLLSFAHLGGGSAPSPAAADLPWPYCAPDAERPAPSPTPWPALEVEPNALVDPAPAPLADLIVIPASVEPAPVGTYPLAEGLSPVTVKVREVLWDAGEAKEVAAGAGVWVGAPADLRSPQSGEILLGLGEQRSDGLWSTRFAVTLSGPSATFIGPSPFAERQTAILEAFRTWDSNPESGADARDLILAWNEEAAGGVDGPIQAAWERFVDRIVLQRTAHPAPGTRAWWEAAPPMCRSVLDAPEEVREGLTFGTVWVRVPTEWVDVRDAVLCLQASVGSVGCSALPRTKAWPYVRFDEAYAVPGEPLEVRVAHLLGDGAVSWIERRTVARIPYDRFTATGIVLVDLSHAGTSMTGYADLDLGTEPDHVPVETLRLAEEEGLLLQAPVPAPSDPDQPQGSGATA
jgi:hypothetical protein